MSWIQQLPGVLMTSLVLLVVTWAFTKRTDERVAELRRQIDTRFDGVNQRFDGVNQRLDGIDQRIDRVEHRMDRLEDQIGQVRHDLTQLAISLVPGPRPQTG